MTFIQHLVVNLLTIVSMSVLLPHQIYLDGLMTAFLVALVLSLLEMTIVPLLKILTLPLSLLTLGLFGFVIDAGMLELTSFFVGNLHFSSFWMALLVAIVLRLVNGVVIKNNALYL